MRILRTIDFFQPNHSESSQQAWQISNRLERKGIRSPILTTVAPADGPAIKKEMLDRVPVTRVPVQGAIGGYRFSFGMITYLRHYDILHSHGYRTFQTDCAFFLRRSGKNRLS